MKGFFAALLGVSFIVAMISTANADDATPLACRARGAVCTSNEQCCSNHCTVQTRTGWKCGD